MMEGKGDYLCNVHCPSCNSLFFLHVTDTNQLMEIQWCCLSVLRYFYFTLFDSMMGSFEENGK